MRWIRAISAWTSALSRLGGRQQAFAVRIALGKPLTRSRLVSIHGFWGGECDARGIGWTIRWKAGRLRRNQPAYVFVYSSLGI